MRSQTCCVAFSLARDGDTLRRDDQVDEYMVLLPSADSAVTVSAGDERTEVVGSAVVVVPPGPSEVTIGASGVVCGCSRRSRPTSPIAAATPTPTRPPTPTSRCSQPWPDPPSGHRIRVYPLAAIKPEPGRFGRILRCSTIMVNYFYPDDGPRDPHVMSPHHHDDFEQLSLQLEGDYVHHIRSPWTVDMTAWRDDDHEYCTSPALTIIPPPTIHTSQSVHHMRHQLIDIFSPPRRDFSERPGWVLNADEYPVPAV